jgi:hypothetical protein
MKTIKNMRELNLMKQKLEYQEQLYEKEITISAAEVVDNMALKLRDVAFDLSARLILQLINPERKHYNSNNKSKG